MSIYFAYKILYIFFLCLVCVLKHFIYRLEKQKKKKKKTAISSCMSVEKILSCSPL